VKQGDHFALRSAAPGDMAAILELERRTPTAAHWSEEQYRRLFAACENASRRITIVVEQISAADLTGEEEPQAVIAGFLVARSLGAEWELENLVVAEAARRRGLGKRLLGELIARARAQGAQSVFLEVRESNLAARALYESAGFAIRGRRKGYYTSPSEDALVYALGPN
jgi:ribosomal-protein-alanine acetyltransferase